MAKDIISLEIQAIVQAKGVEAVVNQFKAAATKLQQAAQTGASPQSVQQQQQQLYVAATRRVGQLGKDPSASVGSLTTKQGVPLTPYQASVKTLPQLNALNTALTSLITGIQQQLASKFGKVSPELAARLQDRTDAAKTGAKEASILAGNSAGANEYRQAIANEKRQRARLAARIEEELAATDQLAKAKAREAAARARQRVLLAEQLGRPTRIAAEADARIAEERLSRAQRLATINRTTRSDVIGEAELRNAERRLRTRRDLATEQRRTPADIGREADLGFVKRLNEARAAQAASAKLATASGQRLLESEGRVAAARDREAAQVQASRSRSLSTDDRYIQAKAKAATAREEEAAKVALAREGVSYAGLSGPELQARAAVVQRVAADNLAAATARQLASANSTAVRAAVERRNAEAQLRAAEVQLERAYIKRALQQGGLPGTAFQRLQARFSATPRAPQEFQGLGEFVGQKVVATAGYGIGASLFYGAVSGISNLIQEAAELEQVFVQINNQLTSLGKGAEIERVKTQVLSIAASSGVASDAVGRVAFQFIGAFGGDTTKALTETASAMKLVQVTGLELNEVVDSLTAIAKTYNVTIAEIGDVTLGLQERFGVLSKEIVTFVGDTAAVGEEAGFTLQELAAIGAVAQQQSGKSGAVLAEQLNRIIPALGEQKNQVLLLYRQMIAGGADFQDSYDNIVKAFGSGDTAGVFEQLDRDFQKLDDAQRDALVRQIGGRREAQTLIALLRSGQYSKELDAQRADPDRDAGRLDSKFQEIQQTLKNTGQRLSETFKQFGEALIASGIGEFLVEVGNNLASILGLLKSVLELGSGFNDLLGGFPGELLKVALTMGVLYKLFSAVNGIGFVTSIKSLFTLKQAVTASTVASGQQAAAHAAVAAAATAEAGAVGAATAADAAQAQSSAAAAAANGFQARASGLLVPGAAGSAGQAGAAAANAGLAARFGGTAFGARAFGGGRFFANSALVSSSTATQTALTGSAGASAGGIAAVGAAGAIAVYSTYQDQNAQVDDAAASFKEQLKTADTEKLRELADTHTEAFDRFAIRFFGDELPEELARTELNIRDSEEGRRAAASLADNPELLKQFREKISQGNLDILGDFYSQGLVKDGYGGFQAKDATPADFAVEQGIGKIEDGKIVVDRDALTPEKIEEIRKKAEEGDFAAAQTVAFIDDVLGTQENLKSLGNFVQDLVNQGKTKEAINAAGGVSGFVAVQTETVKAQFDAGIATQFDYERSLRDAIQTARDLRDSSDPGQFTEKDIAELAAKEKELNGLIAERNKRRVEQLKKISDLEGGNANDAFNLDFAALNTAGLTEFDRIGQLPGLLDSLQAKFQEDLENIKDPLERANKALEGFDVPPEIQRLAVGQQLLDSEEFQTALDGIVGALGLEEEDIAGRGEAAARIAEIVATTDKTVQEATLAYLDEQILALEQIPLGVGGSSGANSINAQLNALRALRDQIASENPLADTSVAELDKVIQDQRQAERDKIEAERDRAEAFLDLAAARAEGNPEAEAAVAIQRATAALNNARADGDVAAIARAEGDLISAQKQAVATSYSIAIAQAELLGVLANGDPVREAAAQIQVAYLQLAQAQSLGDRAGIAQAQGQIAQAQQAAADAQNDIIRSRIEVNKAIFGQDPLAAAQYDLQAADFDLATASGEAERNRALVAKIEAEQAVREQLVEIEKSRLAVAAAIADRDPLKAAQIALQQADIELANAQGEAERNNATAARIRAQNQLEDAIAAISASQINLLQAMASYAGETVEAARLALRAAEEQLSRLISQGAGQEAINNQRAAVVQAKAALRDTDLQDRLGDIDFLLQIGDITTAQAIEMLEAVAQIPDLTEEQVRGIRLKIKSLQQELSRDFQFNLPTFLGLPTLYEARRVTQGTAAGIGYQDNRNVNVQINVSGAQDPNAVAAQVNAGLAQALGGPQFTTGPRRY